MRLRKNRQMTATPQLGGPMRIPFGRPATLRGCPVMTAVATSAILASFLCAPQAKAQSPAGRKVAASLAAATDGLISGDGTGTFKVSEQAAEGNETVKVDADVRFRFSEGKY